MALLERADAVVLGLWDAGMGTARSLARHGLAVAGLDPDPRAPGLRSRRLRAGTCPDVTDAPALLRAILALGSPERPPALLAATDELAAFVATHRDALAGAFRFALPPPALDAFLVDKREQHLLATRAGVPCPRTVHPSSVEEATRLAEALAYPLFVKPRESHVWRRARGTTLKGVEVREPRALAEAVAAVLAAGSGPVVQEVVPGPPESQLEVCAYVGADGAPLATFAARKLRLHPTDFGNATLLESADAPDAVALALRLLRAIAWRGFASVELKRDARDGALKLIEVNPEPQTALPIAAGVDFPWIEYLDLMGAPPPPSPPCEAGVRWWSPAEDLKAYLELRRAGALSAREWVASWSRARSIAGFSLEDPWPLLGSYGARLVRLARHAARGAHARPSRALPRRIRRGTPP